MFQQDIDAKHLQNMAKKLFEDNLVQVLEWLRSGDWLESNGTSRVSSKDSLLPKIQKQMTFVDGETVLQLSNKNSEQCVSY